MNPGSRLVAIGLAIVFLSMVFEYFEYRLSGMAVGFGLVVVGLLLLMSRAGRTEASS